MAESMRELLGRLQRENSAAFVELREFHYSILEISHSIEALAKDAGEALSTATQLMNSDDGTNGEVLRLMHERAANLVTTATQLLAATRELRAGMARWALGGASRTN